MEDCCATLYRRTNIDTFDKLCALGKEDTAERKRLLETYTPPHVTKSFWRRTLHMHSLVCEHKEMIKAQRIGNKLITKILNALINSAMNDIPATARGRLPNLTTFITRRLKEEVLTKCYGAKESEASTYGLVKMKRQENTPSSRQKGGNQFYAPEWQSRAGY